MTKFHITGSYYDGTQFNKTVFGVIELWDVIRELDHKDAAYLEGNTNETSSSVVAAKTVRIV